MDRSQTKSASDADAPLRGEAPAADQLRDKKPEGETPNDSYRPVDTKVGEGRPEQYPIVKDDSMPQADGLKKPAKR